MGKPSGRLQRKYRIMWDQNSGQESYYNPPMSPEKVAQAHFGFFEGTPVDAYVCALGHWPDGGRLGHHCRAGSCIVAVCRESAAAVGGGL